ncbi:MAG: flagellin [Clostridium sp.]
MIINHNMNAMNAHRNMGINNNAAGKSMEKLSSGLRINRAGDDAAGLAISEKMRGQIRGLDQASRNAQDGISLIQTAEGALNETQNILQRMRELSVQSGNDTNTGTDRGQIQKEMDQLAKEIQRISDTTEFNNQKLLDGEFTDKKFQIGANKEQSLNLSIGNMGTEQLGAGANTVKSEGIAFTGSSAQQVFTINGTAVTLAATATTHTAEDAVKAINASAALKTAGITAELNADGEVVLTSTAKNADGTNSDVTVAGAGLAATTVNGTDAKMVAIDVSTHEKATAAVETLQTAIDSVSGQRAELGALQNRLEHTTKNLDNTSENLQAAESRVRDVDMAKEMLNFSKNNILNQAAQSMMAQAKSQPEGVLQLLR